MPLSSKFKRMMEESTVDAPREGSVAVEDGEAAATIRGDDEVLEGVTIGDTIDDAYSSESDEGEEGIVIHAGRTTSRGTRSHRKSFGKNMTYTRPDALSPHSLMNPGAAKNSSRSNAVDTEDELKKLRFLRHATAFDVDVDALDDHPWRSKTVDLLDYFNYGFNERTWLIYCEKQLRLRAQKGLGPYQPPPGAPAPTAVASIAPGPVPTVPTPSFVPPVVPQATLSAVPVQASAPPVGSLQVPAAPTFPIAGPVRVGPPAPPVAPAGFSGSTQHFLPPPPQAPTPIGRQGAVGPPMMPPGPTPGPPGTVGAAVYAPVGPPGPPQRAGMPPPPPVPAGFAPPPGYFNPHGQPPGMGPGVNMNSMHTMGASQQQQQNSSFTGMGNMGPGLDMYGRELGANNGPAGSFRGAPQGPPQGRPFDQNRGGKEWEVNRDIRGPPRDPPHPIPRDYRSECSDRREDSHDRDAGGKRKFASTEDLENPSKRRTGSNSRDRRDRDRDRDRGGRDKEVRQQMPPGGMHEKDGARPPLPLPPKSSSAAGTDRRRDSRDRDLPVRGENRDRKDNSSISGSRRIGERDRDSRNRDSREHDKGSDRRGRSPDNRRDTTRDRSADRDRRPRR